uniref:Uncharacterized protein n=1 Tax=Anguilla anguilla TaxID=7936 RepID=A0A0E9RD94_ANGAN
MTKNFLNMTQVSSSDYRPCPVLYAFSFQLKVNTKK